MDGEFGGGVNVKAGDGEAETTAYRVPLGRAGRAPSKFWSAALALIAALWVPLLALSAGCELLPEPAPPVPTLVFMPLPTSTPQSYSLHTVERRSIQEVVTARGHVASLREALLFFELRGWLKDIHVKPGEMVEEGMLLAELDSLEAKGTQLWDAVVDAEYDLKFKRLQLEQALAEPLEENIQKAKTAVKQAEINKQQAQAAYDRIAWEGDVAGRPEAIALQRADVAYEAAQAVYLAELARKEAEAYRLESLEAQVAYAEIVLGRAKARLAELSEKTQLKAPFSGLVISFEKQVGDTVDPYEPVGAIADPSELRVVATVMESDMDAVTFGQPVSVVLDAYPDRTLKGRIMGIATRPTMWQGKNAYEVTIEFDEPGQVPATIRMGADVSIVTRSAEHAVVVPVEALQVDGQGQYVEVMNGGEPLRVAVDVGLSDGEMIQVISGLSEGDRVRVPGSVRKS